MQTDRQPYLYYMKKIVVTLAIIVGILMMTYPFYSDFLFQIRANSEVQTYQQSVPVDEEKERMLEEARQYNQKLMTGQIKLHDPFSEEEQEEIAYYNSILNIGDNGIMGSIRIPSIDVNLPIYHGTSDAVLEKGVGHLDGTSLPIGGAGTHSVLTGHTGLSSAKLFSDLNQLAVGDIFMLDVVGEKLCYRVRSIYVVEPENLTHLYIDSNEDLCTLVTCTPYGINSHRLLVEGERTDYPEEEPKPKPIEATVKSQWQADYLRVLIVGAGILLFSYLIGRRRQKKNMKIEYHESQEDSSYINKKNDRGKQP